MYINHLVSNDGGPGSGHPLRQSWRWRLGRTLGLIDPNGNPDWTTIPLAMVTSALMAISLFMMAMSLYLYYLDDNPPAEIQRIAFMQDTAVPGRQVHLEVDLCRYTDAPLQLSIAWVDGLRYISPTLSPPGLKPGCYQDIPLVLDVPNLPPGEYALEFQFTYQVNFMRTRSVNYLTGYVTVLRR